MVTPSFVFNSIICPIGVSLQKVPKKCGHYYTVVDHGQATQRPSLNSRGGTASAQDGFAMGHRVRKAHPDGFFMGLGTSPLRRMRRFFAADSGSGRGTAERSAREYGCNGFL